MTEQYWQRYKVQQQSDPYYSNKLWIGVREDIERKQNPKHHLELYNICRSDNPFIRQIKSSPNITTETVAELICRDKGCELQYCLSLQKNALNRRNPIDLKGCKEQYRDFTGCLMKEKSKIKQKEQELREKVFGLTKKISVQLEQEEKIIENFREEKPQLLTS